MAARRGEAASCGASCSANLLDGVSETRLLVIADGPLNGVPFAALLPGPDGRTLLVDRFVLGYASSLALVMRSRRRDTGAPHAGCRDLRSGLRAR